MQSLRAVGDVFLSGLSAKCDSLDLWVNIESVHTACSEQVTKQIDERYKHHYQQLEQANDL